MSDKDTDWIYRESTKKLLMRGLLAACGLSVLLELFMLGREGKFGIDGWFGFYAVLGFVSCTAMIFGAKLLGLWLKAPTDFYEREPRAGRDSGPAGEIAGSAGDKAGDAGAGKASRAKAAKKVARKKVARKASRKAAGGNAAKKAARKKTAKKTAKKKGGEP